MRNSILFCCAMVFFGFSAQGQFGYGFGVSHDLYQRYVNPSDDLGSRGSGSFFLNIGAGPKVWLGGPDFSVSLSGQVNWGIFGLSLDENKGLGHISFPVLMKLNFKGLSGLDKEGRMGFSIGGGLQWTRTELYYVKDEFEDAGGSRSLFRTYVVEASYGLGISGVGIQFHLRAGYDPDTDARTYNAGFTYDFNLRKVKEITDPNSEL